ncbi:MAG: histidine kinase dimerization/phospho-acceptor domain-containing protein, partial [Cyanobacteria bacterium P01_C01_bin.38]
MQQYSSLPEQNSQLDANSSTVLTTIEQLRAELWLECSVNRLQSQLNHCLALALSFEQASKKTKDPQNTQTAITKTEIFQTVVNELNIALNFNVVAIAVVKPQQTVCQISYVSSHSTTHSQPSPLAVMVRKGKKLRLKLKDEIHFEDLQQLENQQPQAAWCIKNKSLGTVGWLITSVKSSTDFSSGVNTIEKLPKFMSKAAAMCAAALTQLEQIELLQQERLQFNNLNQELQRTNQLKNQFLANTSHEIRTPLSSIIGFTHLLLAQGYDPSKQRHHEYLNIIQSSGKHLLALINDILDLSKIEANQLEVNWETIDVRQLCRNVLALVKEKAANKGLQMRLDIDSNIENMVADPLRLKQILLNLLFNAVK